MAARPSNTVSGTTLAANSIVSLLGAASELVVVFAPAEQSVLELGTVAVVASAPFRNVVVEISTLLSAADAVVVVPLLVFVLGLVSMGIDSVTVVDVVVAVAAVVLGVADVPPATLVVLLLAVVLVAATDRFCGCSCLCCCCWICSRCKRVVTPGVLLYNRSPGFAKPLALLPLALPCRLRALVLRDFPVN